MKSSDGRFYIIDEGNVFFGTLDEFKDCFFDNATVDNITAWCEEEGWKLEVLEGEAIDNHPQIQAYLTVQLAREAANKAGEEWMAQAVPKYNVHESNITNDLGPIVGQMLDVCGNAHLQFRDLRSANYKRFKRYSLLRHNAVININHNWRARQEYGLKKACMEAAMKVFNERGITDVRIWSYVD